MTLPSPLAYSESGYLMVGPGDCVEFGQRLFCAPFFGPKVRFVLLPYARRH